MRFNDFMYQFFEINCIVLEENVNHSKFIVYTVANITKVDFCYGCPPHI